MTTVAYLGNFAAPESTENHWRHAFTELGATFLPVQQNEVDEQTWEACASDSDLALLSTTWGWPLPCTNLTWERLQRRGVRTASLHLDLVWGLERERDLLGSDRSHPQFFGPEQVWTSDGTHDARWRARGIDHRWLPPAVHGPNAVVGTARDEYQADVCFAGSVRGYHPEWPRRRELIKKARARWGDRFRYYGPDDGTTIRGKELSDVYASASVVLGDSLCLDGVASLYCSDRVPETAARGGLLVHPWNVAARTFNECATWAGSWDVDGQLDLVDEVLSWSDSQRAWLRRRAHESVLDRHLYVHRAREILRGFGLCEDCDEEAAA